jgi:hypothetical protein
MTLTHQQLHDVKTATAMLPSYQRDLFMRSVSNRLAELILYPRYKNQPATPTDADVHNAISFVLSVRGVSAPRSLRCST